LQTPPKPFLVPLQKTRVLYQFPRDKDAPGFPAWRILRLLL